MPARDGKPSDVRLIATPERAALPAGRAHTLRVLLRVQAPEGKEAPAREPLHLALVLDRSGSMAGPPLEEAKRCARQMVERLEADDRAALVVYDDEVACIAPLGPAGDKLPFHAALDAVTSGASTDLHAGWRRGADELVERLAASGVHRVILLSDGCANAGITDLETITKQCRDLARRGVSTSTYGLGDGFNEALMLAMAQAGRGNAYYGETAADLAEPFLAEFELLTQLCARGLVLRVKAPPEVAVRMRNDYDAADVAQAWKLPDLAYASEAWAVVELDLPAIDAAAGTPVALPVTFTIEGTRRDAVPVFLIAGLPALPLVDDAAHAAMPVDALVATRVGELDAADVLADVRALVESGHWEQAERMVAQARRKFAGHAWAQAVLASLAKLLVAREARSSKEAMYARNAMSRRLSMPCEGTFDAAQEDAVPSFLRRKSAQGRGRPTP